MGIVRGSARLLLREGVRRPFEGSVLQLGRMSVFLGEREVRRWAKREGYALSPAVIEPSHDAAAAAEGCIADTSFFRLLGFDQVASLDVDAWEGAAILHDLNQPVPESLHESADVVYEGGTIQHVFDLPQVLQSIHRLLRPGGRVIHGMAPSHDHVDHGFYMFSPTLFVDFYRANGWTIESAYLAEFTAYWIGGKMHTGPYRVRPYTSGSLEHVSYGRFGRRQVSLFVVATKSPGATGDVIPQQNAYQEIWSSAPPTRSEGAPRRRTLPRPFAPLQHAWKFGRERIRRRSPRRLPPVVAIL